MYRIGILEHDENYLWRLVGFLKEHHRESFEINVKDGGFGLDAVDIKTIEYDALFLGDGFENTVIKRAEIPSRTVVGYLTENDSCDERHIGKYQSMEQIYRQMIKLCESGMDSENDNMTESVEQTVKAYEDFQAEGVTENGEEYRVYHIEERMVDGLAVRMLSGNRIKGILPAKYRDGEWKIRVTGMKRLCDYICENNSAKGKEMLLRFFADMITTALSLEEYMLSADRLLLNPKEIFVGKSGDAILIPYIPLKSEESKDIRQCLVEIRRLCDMLLAGLSGEVKPQAPKEDAYGSTEEFDGLKKNARDSLELKQRTRTSGKADTVTYIIRKRTGEKVVINRSLFKMGKDASYVDYCIKDNPAVSRNHADIVQKPDGFYLVDKGSLNHTFINGRKLEAGEYRKLEDGCLMQLADDVFEFRSLTK
ncbi:MAG: FHA domain-containing protein [Lachnospiraceae bacterium]|nr:FHA domain-containing protein [Lachnospiraceae bacterium]